MQKPRARTLTVKADMNRLRLTAALLLVPALLAGTCSAAPSAVAAEAAAVPLTQATVPVISVADAGVVVGAVNGSRGLNPTSARFSATAGEAATSDLTVEVAGHAEVKSVSLRHEVVEGPEGGRVEVGAVTGKQSTPWPSGHALPFGDGLESLRWTFDRAGTYIVRMVATAELVRAAPAASADPGDEQASADSEQQGEEVSGTADYVIEVSEPAPAASPAGPADPAEKESKVQDSEVATDASSVQPRQSRSSVARGGATVGSADGSDRSIVLNKGHIDLFEVTYGDAGLRLSVKDDTGLYATGAQYRSPADVSLWVDTALSAYGTDALPAAYSFLKDAASTVYLLPLSQNPELPWPGWSTERLAGTLPGGVQLSSSGSPVKLGVTVAGPGEVFTWMTGAFGAVTNTYIDTVDPAPDAIPVARNAHVHTAWAFTAPGDYFLTVSPTATTTTGETVTGSSAIYHVHVGPLADAAPHASVAPSISGSGEIGNALTADSGRWFPNPHRIEYQWLRDGEPIEGATKSEYLPSEADRGHTVTVRVAASIAGATAGAVATGVLIGREVPAEPAVTTVTVAASANSLTLGRSTTLVATVTPRGGTAQQPTGVGGAVEFYDGAVKVGEDEIDDPVSGQAEFVATPATVGEHRYHARYVPPDTHAPSNSAEVVVTVTAAPVPDPDPEDPGDGVPNGSLTESGATILNRGHVDIASLLEGGRLVTKVKDTTESSTPTWRDPAKTVLQALPGARTTVPVDGAFRFLGAAGDPVWLLPETQDQSLLWPGWSTEEIPEAATRTGFDWKLSAIEGPGEFALFTSGAFGEPKVMFNTRDGLPDTTTVGRHVHVHGSWAFSAEGVYCLAFDRATTLAAGSRVSDQFTIAVAVGDVAVEKVDPGKCFSEPEGKPAAGDTMPVPTARLTDQTRGATKVLNVTSGFTAGQLITAQVSDDRAGEWVSVWLHSDPVWLGWARVGTSGTLQVRLPANVAVGAHKLVVKDRSGALVGWDSLSVVKAESSDPPSDDEDDEQTPAKKVASRKCVSGAVVLSAGHIDYSTRIVNGKLESLIGDDTGAKKVFRQPSGTVLWLKPASRVTLPSGYGQIGKAGADIWQVPQTQKAGLIWLGWSTEALNAGNTRGTVSWTLNSVSGPGSVKVYLSGAFGGVQTMVFNGSGSSYNIALGVHAHANWAFSKQGIYRLRMTQTATLANGTRSSDTETLTIAVGDVDPATAARSGSGCGTVGASQLTATEDDAATLQAAEQAAAQAAQIAGGPVAGAPSGVLPGALPNPVPELADGNPVPLLLSVLGGLLLTAAVGTGGYWWWRRRSPDGGLAEGA